MNEYKRGWDKEKDQLIDAALFAMGTLAASGEPNNDTALLFLGRALQANNVKSSHVDNIVERINKINAESL